MSHHVCDIDDSFSVLDQWFLHGWTATALVRENGVNSTVLRDNSSGSTIASTLQLENLSKSSETSAPLGSLLRQDWDVCNFVVSAHLSHRRCCREENILILLSTAQLCRLTIVHIDSFSTCSLDCS